MASEKVAAFIDGVVDAQREMMRLSVALMGGRIEFQTMANASISVAAAALQPAFRTVKANSRRLQRGT